MPNWPASGGGGLNPPVALSDLATQAANTVVANATGSTAVPTAVGADALSIALGIPGPWNTAAVPSGVQDVTLTVVGTRGDIEIVSDILAPANGIAYSAQPNGLATNQWCNGLTASGGSGNTTNNGNSTWIFSDSSGTNNPVSAHIYVRKGRGTDWFFESRAIRGPDAANGADYDIMGRWTGGVALSSIVIHASSGNNIGAGSRIRWRYLNNP